MISFQTPARVGLLGNPSDGYGGRVLALAIDGMFARVSVEASDRVRFLGPTSDPYAFGSTAEFEKSVDRYGYGTGQQLLAATYRTFLNLARSQDWSVPKGVEVRFESSIPRGVGLAGSSALAISFLRGLLDLTGVGLDEELLPSLALSAEVDQLGIAAGLQDRVVQTFGGLIAMDFSEMTTDARTGLRHGRYESVDLGGLPPLFLAYSQAASEPSSTYHGALRARFRAGDPETVRGLVELAGLVAKGKAALRWGSGLGPLMAQNMELRQALGPVPVKQLELIEAAKSCGLDATFCGSGGAIVGVYTDDADLDNLRNVPAENPATVEKIQPFSAKS